MNDKCAANIKRMFLKPGFVVVLITFIMLVLTAFIQPGFFSSSTISSNINTFAPLILLTMGQAVIILAGGLDLSLGLATSMMVVILTNVMVKANPASGLLAMLLAFIACILTGAANGFLVGYLRLPPLIVTYATSYVWMGIGLFIAPSPAGECVNWMRVFYSFSAVEGMPGWIVKIGETLPPAFFLVVIACIVWFIIMRTKLGRHIYTVGNSPEGAYSSGINTSKIVLQAYIIGTFFAFLCALYYAAQNQSGDARMGDPLTLKCIASAIIGGVALSGGQGSVFLSICGALTYSLVSKIIFFTDISSSYQTLAAGLIVLLAVSASQLYEVMDRRAKLKGDV